MSGHLLQLLQRLNDAEIEYILVGGMAAVLHGAPVATQDLDIVHNRSDKNIKKLMGLLQELETRYRGQPNGRVLLPTEAGLKGTGHNNFITSLGPLDLLCELAAGQGYEELLPFAETMTNGRHRIPVLTLKKLIEIKADTGRAKDLMMLPILMKLDATTK